MTTAPEIFVSYRNVTLGWAVTLDQALRGAYGDDRVFRAGRSIRPGDYYETVILDAAAHCRLMVCLVGPTWLARSPNGERLIDRPDDYVRREITAALKAGATVVPVLVDRADRLTGVQLPDEIAGFCDLQSEQLRGQCVDGDLRRILDHLARVVRPSPADGPPGPPPDAVARISGQAQRAAADHPPFTPRQEGLRPDNLASMVERLLQVPEFSIPGFRDEIISLLPGGIGGVLARSARPRSEAVSLVNTCARFSGGLFELVEALRLCTGDIPEVRGFQSAVSDALRAD